MNPPPLNKVLIVESMPFVACALAGLLSGLGVASSVILGSAQEAIAAVESGDKFDLLFVDLDAPGSYGLSLVRHFAGRGLQRRCVVLANPRHAQWVGQVKAMGALAYILKTAPLAEFRAAVAQALDGKGGFPETPAATDTPRLTRRQQDIVGLLHRGYTSKKIASQLRLKTGTVDNHVTGLMRALNASSRTHAVAKAMALGYVSQHDAARQNP
jgi:DNA-binding NarL/FixJ family response regulator